MGHPLDAFDSAIDKRRKVAHEPVDTQLRAHAPELVRRRAGADGVQVALDPRSVFTQRVDVRVDETSGVVQLVRDPRDQPAERCKLLGVN
ncbi:MAG: hypothetical protein ABW205_05135 [Burkholderiales bacterium]